MLYIQRALETCQSSIGGIWPSIHFKAYVRTLIQQLREIVRLFRGHGEGVLISDRSNQDMRAGIRDCYQHFRLHLTSLSARSSANNWAVGSMLHGTQRITA